MKKVIVSFSRADAVATKRPVPFFRTSKPDKPGSIFTPEKFLAVERNYVETSKGNGHIDIYLVTKANFQLFPTRTKIEKVAITPGEQIQIEFEWIHDNRLFFQIGYLNATKMLVEQFFEFKKSSVRTT